MNLKYAIFDLDGTLLDSLPVWDNLGVNMLRSLGYENVCDFSDALRYTLLHHLERDYPEGFDGYFVFDADNLLESQMEKAACRDDVVQSILSLLRKRKIVIL